MQEFFSISYDTFKKYFDNSFIDHLKRSIVPLDKIIRRDQLVQSIHQSITNQHYQPKPPREYIIHNKHNLVTGVVPTFEPEDYCVYFFCLKYLEDLLCNTDRRIKGTFGGWRLGNPIRNTEVEEKNSIANDTYNSEFYYSPPNVIDPLAWRKHWKEFQRLCYDYSNSYSTWNDPYIIKFDISNFYDCISLNFLEHEIRLQAKTKDQVEVIDLLFFFLRFWNRKFEGYKPKTSGIPQDEIGDCSRMLANFYLQPYDKTIDVLCKEKGALYLRFADDQIIFAKSEQDAKELLFDASIELHKIGLNINSSKVQEYKSFQDFQKYMSFDIFNLLEDERSEQNIQEAFSIFEKRIPEGRGNFVYFSVLRRFMSVSIKALRERQRIFFYNLLLDKHFLSQSDFRVMRNIYKILPQNLRPRLFQILDSLVTKFVTILFITII